MRILFLTEISDPGVGSSSRLTFQLAREYEKLGHQCAVVGAVRSAADATPTEIQGIRVFRLHSDYPVRFRAWRSLHNKVIDQPFEDVLAQWKPDLVHAHLIHTHLGYHALTQAKRSGARVIFTAHDVMTFCYQKLTCFHGGEARGGQDFDVQARPSKCIPCQRFRLRPGRNQRIRQVLEQDVDRVTVVSDALGEVLRMNQVPVAATVHNGLALQESLPSEQEVQAFRVTHNLQGRRVLAIGGRLHSQKGVGKLLEMLALLAPDHPDLCLLVMGKAKIYEEEFLPQAQALGVAERVRTTGWLSGAELQQAYAAVDVFVTPSICFDTFGMVNLEAMEHSKPVVATSFGGSSEVVLHGETGFIANPFDLADFAGRVGELLGDPALAQEMGARGRVRLEEKFTIGTTAEAYLGQYGQVLGRA